MSTTTMSKKRTGLEGKLFAGEWVLFLLVLLCFPANLSKRFLMPSAYVRGVLVDYLLPTVYLTEILVLILLSLAVFRLIVAKQFQKQKLFFFFLPVVLLPSLFVSDNFLLSGFRFIELSLWVGFFFWVSKNVSWERDRKLINKALSLGVSWVALLSLAQFFAQRNIFGYLFLGEPVIYPSLGGVAKTSFFGREVLRAYGTFPHPNVLGGTMAVAVLWLLTEGYFLPAGIAVLSLFVSFSQLAWISFLAGLFFLGILRVKRFMRTVFTVSFLVVSPLILSALLLATEELSIIRRVELLQSAWRMICSSPFIGSGLGLFTAKLPVFGLPSGPTLFLQPVHNIFALVAAESGLFALAALLFVFALAVRKAWRRKRFLLLISLSQLTLLALFDHYLYTLPQGLFLFSLTLGFIFSYAKDNGRPAHT